mmetsp:Transcript_30909/g.82868  ORF Transcript_30909/g.82868 Transcript_30909/m.82868 type:complete len:271 (+) Transcript_30909:251-1063(+)
MIKLFNANNKLDALSSNVVVALAGVQGRVDTDGALQRLEVLRRLNLLDLLLDRREALLELELGLDFRTLPVARDLGLEKVFLHRGDEASEALQLTVTESNNACLVPIALDDSVTGEQRPQLGILDLHALIAASGHDVQKGLEGRAGHVSAAVLDVSLSNTLVGGDDGVNALGVNGQILNLGLEDGLRQNGRGVAENTAEEAGSKLGSDTVPQERGGHSLAVELDVRNLLQVSVLNQILGVLLLLAHASPNLRNQQGEVVVHLMVRANDTG